ADGLGLGKVHRQHAVLQLGADLVAVDHLGDGERPVEVADAVLLEQVVGGGLPWRAAAVQDQLAVLEAHLDVVRLHARQAGQQQQFRLRFENVNARRLRQLAGDLRLANVGRRFFLLNSHFVHEWALLSLLFYSALTVMRRGLAASLLGRVTCSTPFSKRASTLSRSTGTGSGMVRANLPKPRSWRCQTPLSTVNGLRSPRSTSWSPSTT